MLDYFTEHIIRKKKDGKDISIIVGLIFAGVLLTILAFPFVFAQVIGQFVFLIIAGVWWGIYFLISGRNVEFEYILTNGELDVDRITARRKRKRLISVPSKEIELICKFNPDSADSVQNVINASSGAKEAKICVLYTTKDGVKTKIMFEPTDKMINIFKKFRPQNVQID